MKNQVELDVVVSGATLHRALYYCSDAAMPVVIAVVHGVDESRSDCGSLGASNYRSNIPLCRNNIFLEYYPFSTCFQPIGTCEHVI